MKPSLLYYTRAHQHAKLSCIDLRLFCCSWKSVQWPGNKIKRRAKVSDYSRVTWTLGCRVVVDGHSKIKLHRAYIVRTHCMRAYLFTGPLCTGDDERCSRGMCVCVRPNNRKRCDANKPQTPPDWKNNKRARFFVRAIKVRFCAGKRAKNPSAQVRLSGASNTFSLSVKYIFLAGQFSRGTLFQGLVLRLGWITVRF